MQKPAPAATSPAATKLWCATTSPYHQYTGSQQNATQLNQYPPLPQLRSPTPPHLLATTLSQADIHDLSDGITTDEGDADDEETRILPTESVEKLKAEKQYLVNQQQDYAPFRPQDDDPSAKNPMDELAQTRIKQIDKKLAYRATPSQRINQHTTAVEHITAKLNNIENQMTLLSKDYNENFHKLSGAKRSLDKARHASLKQLSGRERHCVQT